MFYLVCPVGGLKINYKNISVWLSYLFDVVQFHHCKISDVFSPFRMKIRLLAVFKKVKKVWHKTRRNRLEFVVGICHLFIGASLLPYLIQGLGHECKVEMWLDSYISCYISFSKLNFSLIIKLDVLPCLNILSWPRDMSRDRFVKFC